MIVQSVFGPSRHLLIALISLVVMLSDSGPLTAQSFLVELFCGTQLLAATLRSGSRPSRH